MLNYYYTVKFISKTFTRPVMVVQAFNPDTQEKLCVLPCLALRTKGFEFLASLGNIVRSHFKNKNKNKAKQQQQNKKRRDDFSEIWASLFHLRFTC